MLRFFYANDPEKSKYKYTIAWGHGFFFGLRMKEDAAWTLGDVSTMQVAIWDIKDSANIKPVKAGSPPIVYGLQNLPSKPVGIGHLTVG